jgi:hypothetical protein
MTMPRWLVVSLLSASMLAVLGYGAWWWVTWPDRTIRHFKTLVATGRFDDASALIGHHDDAIDVELDGEFLQGLIDDDYFRLNSPSFADRILSAGKCDTFVNNCVFWVNRSRVVVATPEGTNVNLTITRKERTQP